MTENNLTYEFRNAIEMLKFKDYLNSNGIKFTEQGIRDVTYTIIIENSDTETKRRLQIYSFQNQ